MNTGDEALEVGGVSLRGKSALFVENLINSIQNEFEIVVRRYVTTPIKSNQILFCSINLVNLFHHKLSLQLKFINLKKSILTVNHKIF
jgi:hypothetical protein